MKMLLLIVAAMLAERVSAQHAGVSEALARASQRGALLYAYDQAAWHGTDDMLTKLNDPSSKVGGYIVDGTAAKPRLIFFDKTGQSAVYIATFSGDRLTDGHVLTGAEDRTLSALDRRMILALAVARNAILADGSVKPCASKPFNTVVLPPETGDSPVPVYFLTPQTRTDVVPFGGHYEVDVDASGKASEIRRFTQTCLDMPTRPSLAHGAKPAALFITHLLDPAPTEIHVFDSLVLGTPIMVGIASTKTVWPVYGRLIGKPIPFPKQP